MADLEEVLPALASIVANAIYPNGGASVVGADVKVYPGWPVPNNLDSDLAQGLAHVSIYPRPEERNTTRYPVTWQESVINSDGTGAAVKTVGEQERLFQITIWAPTPDLRAAIAKVIDPALRMTERFTLSDNTWARLTYKSSPMTDQLQKATIYRRDLFYTVEYSTTITQNFYTIKKTTVNLNG